jgi:hypothetical protein
MLFLLGLLIGRYRLGGPLTALLLRIRAARAGFRPDDFAGLYELFEAANRIVELTLGIGPDDRCYLLAELASGDALLQHNADLSPSVAGGRAVCNPYTVTCQQRVRLAQLAGDLLL